MGRKKKVNLLDLTPAQTEIDANAARFKVVNAGRRFGKTIFSLYWQIARAWNDYPGEEHWFVARTYKQAKDIAWKQLLKLVPEQIVEKIDRRELTLTLKNKSDICLKGSDNEDSLRGLRLGSLVMDEAAFQKPHIWNDILRPMTADLKAPVMFISSPRVGWFTRLFDGAISGKWEGWAAFQYTIYDNPYIDRDEIEQIRAQTPEQTFQSEYMAIASTEEGQVYPEFSDLNIKNGHQVFPAFKSWPCVLGLDYGLRDNTGAAWLHFHKVIFMSKEHERAGWDVARHAEVIKRYSEGLKIASGDQVLDQSAFRREGTSMTSIADQFKKEGLYVARSEKTHQAGVDIVKRLLRGDGERPYLFIDPRCRAAIKAFNEWEHGQHEPDILAAIRYGITHGIKRRLTTVLSDLTFLKPPSAPNSEPVFEGPRFRTGRQKESGDNRWDWDLGVPI